MLGQECVGTWAMGRGKAAVGGIVPIGDASRVQVLQRLYHVGRIKLYLRLLHRPRLLEDLEELSTEDSSHRKLQAGRILTVCDQLNKEVDLLLAPRLPRE